MGMDVEYTMQERPEEAFPPASSLSLFNRYLLMPSGLHRHVHSTIVVHTKYVDAILVELLVCCQFVDHTSHNVTLSIFLLYNLFKFHLRAVLCSPISWLFTIVILNVFSSFFILTRVFFSSVWAVAYCVWRCKDTAIFSFRNTFFRHFSIKASLFWPLSSLAAPHWPMSSHAS